LEFPYNGNVHVYLVDNYDSFTYNLYQCLGALGARVTVAKNDAVTVEDIRRARPSHLVISPGPGTPANAGVSMDAITAFAGVVPVLGGVG
jgi:anthranilate/para-aminobenzoate synthase component II